MSGDVLAMVLYLLGGLYSADLLMKPGEAQWTPRNWRQFVFVAVFWWLFAIIATVGLLVQGVGEALAWAAEKVRRK